jgi:hypothetical protein
VEQKMTLYLAYIWLIYFAPLFPKVDKVDKVDYKFLVQLINDL